MEIYRAARDHVITGIVSLSFIKVLTQSFVAEDAFIRSWVSKIWVSLPCERCPSIYEDYMDLTICLQKCSCIN